MLAAVGASLESDEPSVVHGAVDQRGGHVLVAEHAPPAGELDVRGVDHAPGLVGIRYDLEQEPGTLLVDRHVAEGSARRFAHLGLDWLQCIRQSDEGRMT